MQTHTYTHTYKYTYTHTDIHAAEPTRDTHSRTHTRTQTLKRTLDVAQQVLELSGGRQQASQSGVIGLSEDKNEQVSQYTHNMGSKA